MQVKVKFTGHYEDLFGSYKDVELEDGATLHDLAKTVCTSKEHYQAIFDDSGRPKPGVGIEEKNGRRIKLIEAGDSKLRDNDEIIIFHFLPEQYVS